MSEFDINIAYLTATGHRDTTYLTATLWRSTNTLRCCITPNWTTRHRKRCAASCWMPGRYNGYAADLTRTWLAKSDNDYAQLVKDVNDEQLALIATMKQASAMWITTSSSISASPNCCVNIKSSPI
ncbi:hypothetical protein ACNKHT_25480 [Shigella flexneri]